MSAEPVTPLRPRVDLNTVVDEVIDETGEPDPGHLANHVLVRLDDEALRDAAYQLLRSYVRQRLAIHRMNVGARLERSTNAPQPQSGTAVRSWRVDAHRSLAEQYLRQSVNLGPDENGRERWLLLGDCGTDDLGFLVKQREEMALANMGKARLYKRLQDAVRDAGARCVRDLPEQTVLGIFGGDQ